MGENNKQKLWMPVFYSDVAVAFCYDVFVCFLVLVLMKIIEDQV